MIPRELLRNQIQNKCCGALQLGYEIKALLVHSHRCFLEFNPALGALTSPSALPFKWMVFTVRS